MIRRSLAGGVAWPKFDPAKEGQVECGAEGVKMREHFLKDWRDVVELAKPK